MNTENTTTTHEGGKAYIPSKKEQLEGSVMNCMLWEDGFYESGEKIADRIFRLTKEVSIEEAVEVIRKAKFESKLRKVPLFMLVALAEKGTLTKELVNEICTRVDDMTNLLSMYFNVDSKKPMSIALKKGLALSFKKFNEYQLAKYNRSGQFKLKDVIMLCHPKPDTKEQSELFKKVLENKLEVPYTWETELSAGKDKKETFEKLISEKKLGDLAFLRNLRLMKANGVSSRVISDSSKERIWKNILPFQFVTANRNTGNEFREELEEAMFKCLEDSDKFGSNVNLLVDMSSSMLEPLSRESEVKRAYVASGLAILCKEKFSNTKIYGFTKDLKEDINQNLRGFALSEYLINNTRGSTKMWNAIREVGKKGHSKVTIVITDEETRDTGVFEDANSDFLFIINVATSAKTLCEHPKFVKINGWSESVIDYIVKHASFYSFIQEEMEI